MSIVHSETELRKFVHDAFRASSNNTVLVDKFLEDAYEVDVDHSQMAPIASLQVSYSTSKRRVSIAVTQVAHFPPTTFRKSISRRFEAGPAQWRKNSASLA